MGTIALNPSYTVVVRSRAQDGKVLGQTSLPVSLTRVNPNTPTVSGEDGKSRIESLEDRWHLGSDTKAMIATLAGILAQRDEIPWSPTIGDVFPDWTDMDPEMSEVGRNSQAESPRREIAKCEPRVQPDPRLIARRIANSEIGATAERSDSALRAPLRA